MLKSDFLRFLPAPNIFADRDVLLVSLGEQEGFPEPAAGSDLLAATESFLDEALGEAVGVGDLSQAEGEESPQSLALEDLVARALLRLQRAAGYDVGWYHHLRGIGPVLSGDFLVVDCANPGSGPLLLELALLTVDSVAAAAAGNLTPEARQQILTRLGGFAQADAALGGAEDYRLMIEAARRRNLPITNLLPHLELLQLGQGAKRRKVHQHFPAGSDYTGVKFSVNKNASARLMRAAGLPTLESLVVFTAEQGLRAAQRLGYPVVVKPNRGDYGEGINVFLQNDEEVRHAFARIARREVLVEKHQQGDNHRLLAMYGRFVSAVRQAPAQVRGDGRQTVSELVAQVNAGRTADLTASLRRITLDDDVDLILKKQGYGRDDVPPDGARVLLRFHSNLSVGGTMENVTDSVHPDNQDLVLRAARVMDLEVAGMDFITTDISRSWLEGDCAIIEINATPGFIHGLARGALEDHFLAGMFPEGDDGRIPTVYVVDEGSGGALSEAISRQLAESGRKVALARQQETRLGGRTLCGATSSHRRRGGVVYADPQVEAAVIEVSLAEIVCEGLGQPRCSLVVFGPGSARAAAPDPQCTAAAALLASIAGEVVISAGDGLLEGLARVREASGLRQVDDSGAGLAAWRAAASQALRAARAGER